MIYRLLYLFFLPVLFLGCKGSSHEENPIKSKATIYLADPTIFYYEGNYYLYGTSGYDANQGFLVYTSTDMKSWKGPSGINEGYALRKEDVFGDKGFWAPQVFNYNNKIYMAYTANENIAIAESDNPLGPFTQATKKALEAPVKQIDPFVFIDDDDKKYLYHVRLTEGNRLFVAEMADDFLNIKPETLRECITAEEAWENTDNVEWPVAEGPSVLKHNDLYYFIYSTNDFRNPDYSVGYAISDNPYGPWEKFEGNPILSRNNVGKNGSGHGDFIKNNKGNLFYVFHTHYSNNKVSPRKTAVVEAQFKNSQENTDEPDKLAIDQKSFYYLQVEY